VLTTFLPFTPFFTPFHAFMPFAPSLTLFGLNWIRSIELIAAVATAALPLL